MDAIEAERLRLREQNQHTSSGQHYRVVTAELATLYDDDALIRGAARLRSFSPIEARWAATLLETELRLRQSKEAARTGLFTRRSFWAAFTAAVIGLVALVMAGVSLWLDLSGPHSIHNHIPSFSRCS